MQRVEWQGMESRVSGTRHSHLQSKILCLSQTCQQSWCAQYQGVLKPALKYCKYFAMSVQACVIKNVHSVLKHLNEA